jgi:hypothetical protein
MITRNPRVAFATSFTISPARVRLAARAERPFSQFLRVLLRALGAMHT